MIPRVWWTKRRPRREESADEGRAVDLDPAARVGGVQAGEDLDEG